jgi:hypothetical protein
MSEEDNIHDNGDLSGTEEEVTSTEPEIELIEKSELKPEPEVEIISSVTEEGGIGEVTTEEAVREAAEQIQSHEIEEPIPVLTKPKKQTTNTTITKIQWSLDDASKHIKSQSTQINKVNQNLQSLQKQMKSGQLEILNQIRSQVNQIQRQVFQVQKRIQKRSTNKLKSSKKVVGRKKKSKK